jgi:hypothetical protein
MRGSTTRTCTDGATDHGYTDLIMRCATSAPVPTGHAVATKGVGIVKMNVSVTLSIFSQSAASSCWLAVFSERTSSDAGDCEDGDDDDADDDDAATTFVSSFFERKRAKNELIIFRGEFFLKKKKKNRAVSLQRTKATKTVDVLHPLYSFSSLVPIDHRTLRVYVFITSQRGNGTLF